MHKRMGRLAALLLCPVMLLPLCGCRVRISVGADSYFTGESYPDAEKYRTGAFTYAAKEITAADVYWRSGEVVLTESEDTELNVSESGGALPEETAMHWLLEDGVLRIRFCASGASICVDSADKRLRLAVPKGIELSVHTTSADVRADVLEQKSVLVSVHSGETELGTVRADEVDLSSSSGSVRAAAVSAQTLKCRATSGSVTLGTVTAGTLHCATSSGTVRMDGVRAETASVTASSGDVKLTLTGMPEAVVRTSSGRITLSLPAGGAEVLYDSNSGKLRTERPFERKGDLYVFGGGKSRLTAGTTSGDLEIR